MSLEEYLTNPITNQKLINLISLMTERNLYIDIINALKFQKIASDISDNEFEILYQKFSAKLTMIEKKLKKESNGLVCIVCNKKIQAANDDTLACLSCGMPFHSDHYIDSIRRSGFCPACGEYFELVVHDDLISFNQQFINTAEEDLRIKFPQLEFKIYGRIIKNGKEIIPTVLLCPECGKKIEKNWVFCKFCGAKVKNAVRKRSKTPNEKLHQYIKCPRCGKQVKTNWKHCKWCGTTLQ
ncbi:MAG: zinc ribbon domain-containing protein [Promethearchaeota archaeon]|nr:MAG: zinc ribbon domain-containing protein [Candidatus Lokiarchaeota archaeon]